MRCAFAGLDRALNRGSVIYLQLQFFPKGCSIGFSSGPHFRNPMGVKFVLAKLLEAELNARGVRSIPSSDCVDIVHRLLEQLTEIELTLAAREVDEQSRR